MSQSAELTVQNDGPYRIVTLDRPDRMNSLSRAILTALESTFTALASDRDARVIVLTGSGERAFCAGADLKERQGMSEDDVRAVLQQYRRAFGAIDRSPVPVIAALNGAALGGGYELALACDLRIAVPHAVVGLPETSLGIIPGAGGTQRLARLVGPGRAKELILLARRLGAAEAKALGLLTAVAEAGENVVEAAKRFTSALADGAPIALAAAMEAIDLGYERDLGAALDLEIACYERTLVSADRREALAAFREKRSPVFRGE